MIWDEKEHYRFIDIDGIVEYHCLNFLFIGLGRGNGYGV
jgi:hypothetical protein